MGKVQLTCLLLLALTLAVVGITPVFRGCGGQFYGVVEGSIEWPNEPQPKSINCTWDIVVDDGMRLSVRFEHFSLYIRDKLDFYNGEGGTAIKLPGKNPKPFVTEENKMYITFSSKLGSRKSSFKLIWEIFDQEKENKIAASVVEFSILHKISGKFLSIQSDFLVFLASWSSASIFTFEEHQNEWGYIHHKQTSKVLNISTSGLDESIIGRIRLSHDRRPWNLFAIDQVNKNIIALGNVPLQPLTEVFDQRIYPNDGDFVKVRPWNSKLTLSRLTGEFEIVSATSASIGEPKEIANIYGEAKITGSWHLVYLVINPKAEHTYEVEVKVGRSKTRSSTTTFKYSWEVGFEAQYWFASMSVNMVLSAEIQQSSSMTWESESTRSATIKVVPGKTVAVWQRDYQGEQYGHRAVHGSNMLADTDSPKKHPDEYTPYRFI